MASPNTHPELDNGNPDVPILIRLGCTLLLGFALLAASCDGNRLGAIQGTVVDGTSARVSDAFVVVINLGTNNSIGLKTVRKAGFQPAVRSNIVLDADRTVRVDLNLVSDTSSLATPVKASEQR
jgi:hypothetical protein